jgi:hypothetical protein
MHSGGPFFIVDQETTFRRFCVRPSFAETFAAAAPQAIHTFFATASAIFSPARCLGRPGCDGGPLASTGDHLELELSDRHPGSVWFRYFHYR